MNLASPNHLTKDVAILAVVIAELELGHVQRQIFRADFVEGADDPAFHQRPEAFATTCSSQPWPGPVRRRAAPRSAISVTVFGATSN
jgi:hypothetical protein